MSAPQWQPCRRAICAGRAKVSNYFDGAQSWPFQRRKIPPSGPMRTAALGIDPASPNTLIALAAISPAAASSQKIRRRSAPQASKGLFKRRKLHHLGNVEALGLFSSLYGVRQHPVVIHPCYLRVVGPHRPDPAAAHFAGLLGDEIKSCLLDRREEQPKVGSAACARVRLFTTSRHSRRPSRPNTACHSPSRPLNSATVSPSRSRITFNR